MARDLGVQADYVDRAFRKLEEQAKLSPEQKRAIRCERWLADMRALESVQASRPKKPPNGQ